jgi:hypothetical protein
MEMGERKVYFIWSIKTKKYMKFGRWTKKSIWTSATNARKAISHHIASPIRDDFEVHEFELLFKRKV